MNWVKKGNIFNDEWAQLPVVDVYDDFYKIYYSTRDEKGRSIPKWIKVKKYELKIIEKGNLNELDLGKPGSFDSYGIMPTEIINVRGLGGRYKYMYYVGWSKRLDVPYWNSLGLAKSEDWGETWKKYSEAPILSSDINDTGFVGTCGIIRDELHYKMYYSSAHWEEINGKQECIYDIKMALSGDGVNWEKDSKTIIPLNDFQGGISSPRIIKDYPLNKMYFSIRGKKDYRIKSKDSYKIRNAHSKDLINWEIDYSGSKWVEPGKNEDMCAYPYIIYEYNKYLMFYNTDFGKSGISYAELEK
jgi:hypothetical protein